MNIIISSLSEIKKIGTSTDLDSAKLFISKSILETDRSKMLLNIFLNGNGGTYPLIASQSSSLEKNDYYGYFLNSRVNIEDGTYTFSIDTLSLDGFVILGNEKLIDEHDPIYIIGRQINPVKTQILAQDFKSQQFTFYIKKKYDGISFLDSSKRIYVDYIPVDRNDLILEDGSTIEFLSDEIKEKIEIQPPHGQEGEWLALKWDLPYPATKMAGSVRFALSVIDSSNDARAYTWQTLPSSFTVSKNIGLRNNIVLTPEEESQLQGLIDEVDSLRQDVDAIDAYLGEQTDTDPGNDEEIVWGGGGAPIGG